jgi:Tfp pilus assembly protein PilN
VKPLHLNLASRPYRDYRPVYAVVVVMTLLTAFLALNNVETWLRYRTETQNTRAKIEQLEKQTEVEEQRRKEVNARMPSTSDIKLLASRTQFANARLAERAFSWSELLDRLERVLPPDVRIDSVSPAFSKEGLVHLALQCTAKTGTGMTTTLDHLNRDAQHFANAFPSSEANTGTGFQFAVGVDYRPSITRPVE